jgi:hypothetical protein
VRAEVEVPVPLVQLRRRWEDPGDWLAPLAEEAERDGRAFVLRVGPTARPALLARRVRAEILGSRRTAGGGIVLWLRWEAADHPGLFPALDGEVAFTPLVGARTRAALTGSYVPPLGALGDHLDRRLLHRLADRTVQAFLLRLTDALASGMPAEITLPADATSPARARRFVEECGPRLAGDADTDDLRLLVSELVTRAIAGGGSVRVRLVPIVGGVVAEVHDDDPVLPRAEERAPLMPGETPRPMLLIDRLADGWGAVASGQGKTIWLRLLSTPTPTAPLRSAG